MNFNPFIANTMVATPPQTEETFEESQEKINMIINNVQTTRQDLQDELEIYERKLTILEQEFIQYQNLAMKVVAALKVIDTMTTTLTKDTEEVGNLLATGANELKDEEDNHPP